MGHKALTVTQSQIWLLRFVPKRLAYVVIFRRYFQGLKNLLSAILFMSISVSSITQLYQHFSLFNGAVFKVNVHDVISADKISQK